ncbi:MAG: hypothetical protein SVT56_05080 [Chloroflexota bacterium]|nr:hypothetical protein [Chloroflexota bacterium]
MKDWVISGERLSGDYLFLIVAMFFAASASVLFFGRVNQAYLLLLPLSIIVGALSWSSRAHIPRSYSWGLFWAVVILLFLLASIKGLSWQGSDHYGEWNLLRSMFIVNLALIYLAWIFCKRYPLQASRSLYLSCVIGVIVTGITFLFYIGDQLTIFRFFGDSLIHRNNLELPFTGVRVDRFNGLFKEPAEAGFFLVFSALILAAWSRYILALLALFMGVFLFSNSYAFLLLVSVFLIIGLHVARHFVMPVFILGIFTAVSVFIIIEPNPKYFQWIDYFLPRAENLYAVRDVIQRLWTNWNAAQDFAQLYWPLGGGAGFIRVYEQEFYLFSREAVHGAGAGVFKFLSDFGVFGVVFLIIAGIQLHRIITRTDKNLRNNFLLSAALLCLVFSSVRTGYYNISVWAAFFMALSTVFVSDKYNRSRSYKDNDNYIR